MQENLLKARKEETAEEKAERRKLEKEQKAQEKAKKKEAAMVKEEAQKKPEKEKKEHGKKEVNYTFPPLPKQPLEKPSKPDADSVLITSALPYVNNVPHLGNIIGCVLSADVFARFCRLDGRNTLYVCGTDEYGTATEVKALLEKMSPKQICEKYSKIHKAIYDWFDISFDYFGRTSTPSHEKVTQEAFLALRDKGFILQKTIEQTYCAACAFFLADRYVLGTCPHCEYPEAKGDQCDKCGKLLSPEELKSPKCLLCKGTPELRPTDHYFIDLPKIQPMTEKWFEKRAAEGDWDENAVAITKAWLRTGLKERCITRDLKWGVPVPVPGSEKVFYVWFDAPYGYVSITRQFLGEDYKEWWLGESKPRLYQFMGKDNVPFHTVIFPSSMLGSALDWNTLFHISTTEYLNYEDGKFSKSNGTGVFGDDVGKVGVPNEVWRYYLLVNRPEKSDTVFTWSDFVVKNNNELLPNLGNLVNRVMKQVFGLGAVPEPLELEQPERGFLAEVEDRFRIYHRLLSRVQIKDSLKMAMEMSMLGNKYLQECQPWEKTVKEKGRHKTVLFVAANFIRLLAAVFEPFMPAFADKVRYLLAEEKTPPHLLKQLREASEKGAFRECVLSLVPQGRAVPEPIVLFRECSVVTSFCGARAAVEEAIRWQATVLSHMSRSVVILRWVEPLLGPSVPRAEQPALLPRQPRTGLRRQVAAPERARPALDAAAHLPLRAGPAACLPRLLEAGLVPALEGVVLLGRLMGAYCAAGGIVIVLRTIFCASGGADPLWSSCLVALELVDEAGVGVDNGALGLDCAEGRVVAEALLPHQVGDHQGGRPRDPRHAVHQHVGLAAGLLDEPARVVEEGGQVEGLGVDCRNVLVEGDVGPAVVELDAAGRSEDCADAVALEGADVFGGLLIADEDGAQPLLAVRLNHQLDVLREGLLLGGYPGPSQRPVIIGLHYYYWIHGKPLQFRPRRHSRSH